MFFSARMVVNAMERLKSVHPFFGITFFACKRNSLPAGKTTAFPMDGYLKNIMADAHKIADKSEYYFQPYKSNGKTKEWVDSGNLLTDLRAINVQSFSDVFIHIGEGSLWGWKENYADILREKLDGDLLPAFELAVWFLKHEQWQPNVTLDDIIGKFFRFFNITGSEREKLFSLPESIQLTNTDFQDEPVTWEQLGKFVPAPPDGEPPQGARLAFIETKNIGPIGHLTMEANDRLNLITGDNGLGKTFLMECCWWVLTGSWPENTIVPGNGPEYNSALINFELKGNSGKPVNDSAVFDRKKTAWLRGTDIQMSGLHIYARADGSYAVWDPLKQNQNVQGTKKVLFTKENIWDGETGRIEGLVRDWVNWQRTGKEEFRILRNVLEKMSPPDLGDIEPGDIDRILNDTRDMPTIKHRYGSIPVVHASAGIKRVLTLAYLIAWTWNEHKIQARLQNARQENRMVVLIDEIEEHLHPKWQRVILPSLLDIQFLLSKEMEMQFIVSTHSPLILASMEPHFNPDIDRLFNISLEEETNRVSMSEVDFIKHGQINSWLTSRIFNLGMARSKEAEETIEKAKKLQLRDRPDKNDILVTHNELRRLLSQEDSFWPRWIFWAEKMGVKI